MKKLNWPLFAVLLTCSGFLISKTGSYLPFISDDAFISLRYSKRLIEGHGLTWTDGQPVEGYSNLIWVIAIAALGRLGVDLVLAARVLGVASMVGVLVTLAIHLGRRYERWTAATSALAGSLFLAFSAPIAVWGIGGLEQPLYAVFLAAAIALMPAVIDREGDSLRPAVWLSLPLGLLCLTRPDGPIFTVVAFATILAWGWIAKKPRPLMHAMTASVAPIVMTLGQLVFRLAYYGTVIPNTALVKVAGSSTHRTFGLEYLWSGLGSFWPFSVLAAAGAVALIVNRRTRGQGIFLVATAIAWSGYVVFVGGDVFPAYRHLVPLIVVLAFCLSEGVAVQLAQVGRRAIASHAVVAAIAIACVVPFVGSQAEDKWIKRASTERWEWQAKELALVLKTVFESKQPLVAVTAAGAIPYYSNLPSLDMMGLNDYYIPRHRPETFGSGMVGHELGDGKYVMQRQPDLIIFDVGAPQPSWRTGEELNAMPEFHQLYVPVRLRVSTLPDGAVVFINKHSALVGAERSGGTISIPGYLFTGSETVSEVSGNSLIARLGTQPARFVLPLEGGESLTVDNAASKTANADASVSFAAGGLTITITPRGSEATIARLVLRKP